MEQAFKAETDGFNLFNLSINEHTGPHIDAPLHLSADGRSVDEIPIGNLVVPLCVVDIREKAAANPDARLTPDDLTAWIEANDDIADRTCVAMMSGWGRKVAQPAYRGEDADGGMHFPGFHPEAVEMLSLDHGRPPISRRITPGCPPDATASRTSPGWSRCPPPGPRSSSVHRNTRAVRAGPARIFGMV